MTPFSALTIAVKLGLFLALLGTVSSTVFLLMALLAAVRFRTKARKWQDRVDGTRRGELPPVTVLKPVHGAEPNLEENLESFFLQDYPEYEIIFGCRDSDDPALDRLFGAGEADLGTTFQNLRQITDNLRDLTEEARRYPSNLLFGAPPRPLEPAK